MSLLTPDWVSQHLVAAAKGFFRQSAGKNGPFFRRLCGKDVKVYLSHSGSLFPGRSMLVLSRKLGNPDPPAFRLPGGDAAAGR